MNRRIHMANNQAKKYALVAFDAEMTVVRKMGVAYLNIYDVSNRPRLLQQLKRGDTLCIARLSSVCTGARDVYNLLNYLARNKNSFQSENEKYLNFSPKNILNNTRQSFLYQMALKEEQWVTMLQRLNTSNDIKNYLCRAVENQFLEYISWVFLTEGIKKY